MANKRSSRKKAKTAQQLTTESTEKRRFVLQHFITALILLIYGFFLAHQNNLAVGDLGRHLKNGQLFVESGLIARTNLYSYTYPDYPFINHHWGSGVVFYLIERFLGISGLSIAFILISLVTLFLFLKLAIRYSSFALAAPIAVVALPVLITRHEVRPELFSYLFSGLFLHVLWGYKDRILGVRWLFLLPLLQVLWVNLHIYFFLGVVLIAVFLFELLATFLAGATNKGITSQLKALARALILTMLAACVNPSGIAGAIYPLFILDEYEVPVIENYSVPAILEAGFEFIPLIYFLIAFGLLCLSWVYVVAKHRARFSLGNFLLSVMVSAMAWGAIRNFALFAYFALAVTAVNLKGFQQKAEPGNSTRSIFRVPVTLLVISLVLVLIKPAYFVSSNRGRVGIGLEPGNDAAAKFFLQGKLQGPVVNNFDVAGYLIYHLYPTQQVFVDNRPEAYPGSFFREVYFPLQADEETWKKISDLYGFNVIFFNHRERSVRGQQFIVRRVLDPAWAPVFFDRNIVILVKRHGPNQSTIAKYELPKESVLARSN
jgi:hypothetical protein